jgi:ribonuclease BN (tRNA processing enzyme)
MKPSSVTIRSYQVGFGDCFLASFKYPTKGERHVLIDFGSTSLPAHAPKTRMLDVANDIAKRSGGELTAVIATHRHKDHVSGFQRTKNGKGAGDIIAALKPKLVIQPWTEDPKIATTAKAPSGNSSAKKKNAFNHAMSLGAMQSVAGQILAEAKRVRGLSPRLREELNFIGEDNIGNADAVRNLMTMGKNEYLYAGKSSGLAKLLPGVNVDVLGPPTIEQSQSARPITRQTSKDKDEFWLLQAAASEFADEKGKSQPVFANYVRKRSDSEFPQEARWLIYHAKQLRGEQMLRIVRILDKAMNNTSLILLFRIGSKSLLFPGDAQIENWSYSLSQAATPKLLKAVDLYKVGHHGSLNATPKSLWKLFEKKSTDATDTKRLKSIMSTMAGKHGNLTSNTEVPRRTLTAELKRQSELFSTEQLSGTKFFHDTELRFKP